MICRQGAVGALASLVAARSFGLPWPEPARSRQEEQRKHEEQANGEHHGFSLDASEELPQRSHLSSRRRRGVVRAFQRLLLVPMLLEHPEDFPEALKARVGTP